MAENILFVLVGRQKRKSSLMRAPREECVVAVEKLRQTSKYYAQATVDLNRLPEGEDSTVFEGCVLETASDSWLPCLGTLAKRACQCSGARSSCRRCSRRGQRCRAVILCERVVLWARALARRCSRSRQRCRAVILCERVVCCARAPPRRCSRRGQRCSAVILRECGVFWPLAEILLVCSARVSFVVNFSSSSMVSCIVCLKDD